MTTSELLIRARQRIEDPARWTQNVLARDLNGHPVDHNGPAAAQWCAAGAVSHERYIAAYPPAYSHDSLWEYFGGASHLVSINNAEGHAATIDLFDKAIARASEDEMRVFFAEQEQLAGSVTLEPNDMEYAETE